MASQEKEFQSSDNKGGQRRRRKKNIQRPFEEGGVRNGSYDDPLQSGAYQARGRGGGAPYPHMDPPQFQGGALSVDPRTGKPALMPYQPHGMYPGPSPRQHGSQGHINPHTNGGGGGGQKKSKQKGKNGKDKQQQQPQQQKQQQQPEQQKQQPKVNQQQQQQSQQQQNKVKGNQVTKGQGQQGKQPPEASTAAKKNISQSARGAGQEVKNKSKVEDMEEKVDNATLREMEKQKVFPLKKKSVKFPRAKFFCRLCEYHLDRVQDYRKHVSEPRHKRRKEVTDAENTLRYMPHPKEKQMHALNEVLEKIYITHGLTAEDVETRKAVVKNVETFIHKKLPGVSLQMYGSSLTGFGLKSSDVNIDLFAADVPSLPKMLIEVFHLLKDAGEQFDNVHSDFSAKIPAIVFIDPQTKLECKVTINSRPATATSQLLAVYSTMDPRVRKLAIAFRYWAKVCRLDVQCEGTLPAYATSLMTVFFLQHLPQPVLPVFSKYLPKNVEDDSSSLWVEKLEEEGKSWESENSSSAGFLWLEMLRYFSLGFDTAKYVVCLRQQKMLARAEKKWNSKKLAIEDPFSQKRNVARTVSNTKIYEYFQDSLRKAYYYFGLPRSKDGVSLISSDILSTIVEKSRKTLSDMSPDLEDTDIDNTDAARDSSLEPEQEMSEATSGGEGESSPERQLSDTFQSPSENQSHSSVSMLCEEDSSIISAGVSGLSLEDSKKNVITNVQDFARDFAVKVVQSAVMEVLSGQSVPSGSVSTVSGESSVRVSSTSGESLVGGDVSPTDVHIGVSSSSSNNETTLDSKSHVDRSGSVQSPVALSTSHSQSPVTDSVVGVESPSDVTMSEGPSPTERDMTAVIENCEDEKSQPAVKPVDLLLKGLNLDAKDCFYEFSEKILTDGKGPAIICGYCEREGHLKTACPEDQLPKLSSLPPMKKFYVKMLSVAMDQVPRDFGPTHEEMKQRDYILYELQDFIRQLYPGASLRLFGSSCNGFGFHQSDLDICMTFASQKTAKDIKCAEIIERLAKKLKEHKGLYQVVAIPTAKVPIVKFRHRHSQLEGDISLYNTLAQHNTQLLWAYSEIDPRVKALGYAFKVFAKVCDIGDASRGSLSSYAYVLMLLHYLQQCRPPVIPVLQELYHGKRKPEWLVDDCNAYFFENLKELPRIWKDYGRNKLSVGELWLGLFRYYTEEFNYKELVVCIRQKAPLSRFEKLWNGKCLAIEDPFDLNHNLGAGLSRKMNNYILKAFIHGRELYGTPVDEARVGNIYRTLGENAYKSPKEDVYSIDLKPLQDYFFDRSLLTEGTPPNDRGCRVCGKIGHIAKECPVVTNRKEREERDRRLREDRAKMNKRNDQMSNASQQNTMSPSAHHSKSHSSPSTPGVSHMNTPPGFREQPHRSKSMPEESHSTGANLQMSPPAGYRQVPILYDPKKQQIFVQSKKPSPLPIPLIGGAPISPVGKGRPDQVPLAPRQVSSAGMISQGSPSASLPMMQLQGQNNYIPVSLSQVLNVTPQSPPTPGQQIMMAISPQKQAPGMGHSQMMSSGPYSYSQSVPTSHMHSPPQQVYVQAPMAGNPTSPRQVTQTATQQGGNLVLNITVPNDLYNNYNQPPQ